MMSQTKAEVSQNKGTSKPTYEPLTGDHTPKITPKKTELKPFPAKVEPKTYKKCKSKNTRDEQDQKVHTAERFRSRNILKSATIQETLSGTLTPKILSLKALQYLTPRR